MNLFDWLFPKDPHRVRKKKSLRTSGKVNSPSPHIIQEYGVEFEIIRKAHRKNLSIQVKPHERVRVLVNRTTPLREIQKFLIEKRHWVVAHIEKMSRYPKPLRPTYAAGTSLLYLGENHIVQHVPTDQKRSFVSIEKNQTGDRQIVFHISKNHWPLKGKFPPEVFDKLLQIFLKKKAHLYFVDRLHYFAKEMGLRPRRLTIRGQRSRWGSCTSQGTISLNWKLMMSPPWVIDAVIVHELSHLKHLNHSKHFWEIVNRHAPQHAQADLWLQQNLPIR